MSVRVTIYCDDCGAAGGGGKTAKVVRTALLALGWRYFWRGVDRCPTCVAAQQAREREANPLGYY